MKPAARDRFAFRPGYAILSVAVFLLAWQLLAALLVSPLLPGPWVVARKLWTLIVSGRLIADLGWTLLRVVAGTVIGFLLGVGFGILAWRSRAIFVLFDPVFQLLRPVSPFAWTPLVILIFGLGNAPAIVTILVGIFFPTGVAAYESLRNIDPDLRDTARIFGVSGWSLLREVELPLVAPQLLALFRVLFGVGWVLAIGAEMLAANSGLGFRLMNARYLLDFPELYAVILAIGLAGYALDLGLRRAKP